MKLCETVDERSWRGLELTMCVASSVKMDNAYPVKIPGGHYMSA